MCTKTFCYLKIFLSLQIASSNDGNESNEPTRSWSDLFVQQGGLRHLFDIFMSGKYLHLKNQNKKKILKNSSDSKKKDLLKIFLKMGLARQNIFPRYAIVVINTLISKFDFYF